MLLDDRVRRDASETGHEVAEHRAHHTGIGILNLFRETRGDRRAELVYLDNVRNEFDLGA
ncbi:hypothetical protein D3C87_2113840 [compost metagenome]